MGVVVISIGGLLLTAWVVRVMMRLDNVNRERALRRREAWEAEGRSGAPPDDYIRGAGGTGT
jgi:hypothetical protein